MLGHFFSSFYKTLFHSPLTSVIPNLVSMMVSTIQNGIEIWTWFTGHLADTRLMISLTILCFCWIDFHPQMAQEAYHIVIAKPYARHWTIQHVWEQSYHTTRLHLTLFLVLWARSKSWYVLNNICYKVIFICNKLPIIRNPAEN